MSAHCSRCGQEWLRDPALEVTCPTCFARVGVRCRRPSGHGGNFVGFHAERDRAAMREGILSACPAAAGDQLSLL